MSEENTKILDMTASEKDGESAVYAILELVRPNWIKDDIQIKRYTEGWINHMFRAVLKSDSDKENALVVRIFGSIQLEGQEPIKMPIDEQVMAMQVAHIQGIAEPVVAIFKNGIVYKYAPGRTLTAEDMKDPEIIRLICWCAVRFHYAEWDKIKVYNNVGEFGYIERKEHKLHSDELFEEMSRNLPDYLPDLEEDKLMKSIFPPKQKLIDEFFKAKKRMNEKLSKLFQHNDFHMKNMVYNPETKTLRLIDYDTVGDYWIGGDLAKIAALAPLCKDLGFTDENFTMSDEEMLTYVRTYIEERNIYLGRDPENICEKDVEIAFWQMKMCWIMFHPDVYIFQGKGAFLLQQFMPRMKLQKLS